MDEESLAGSLSQLQQQEEATRGLLSLNPQNEQFAALLQQITEAREVTESALLAFRQARLLDSLERTPTALPPPPPLPAAGSRVMALYADNGKHYPAHVDAHMSPTVARLRWLYATAAIPCFYATAHALRAHVAPSRRSLINGAPCLALRPGHAAEGSRWELGRVVARGGNSESLSFLVELRRAASAETEEADLPEHGGLLPSSEEQVSLAEERVVPLEYAVPLVVELAAWEQEEEEEGEGVEGDAEGADEDSAESGEDGEEGDEGGEAEGTAIEGSGGVELQRPRGALGDFENHTRGFGSRMMMRMGYRMGEGIGKLAEGRVRCLQLERLPAEQKLTLDGLAAFREKRQSKRATHAESIDTGVKRGGANQHRGDFGRRQRARKAKGLAPQERREIDRALARGPEPPDMFDFLNSAAQPWAKSAPSEVAVRSQETKRAVQDKKLSVGTLRRQLLAAQERTRAIQTELQALEGRSIRHAAAHRQPEVARPEGPTMGSALASQDVGRRRALEQQVVALRRQESHLQRLLSGKEETKKLYKF